MAADGEPMATKGDRRRHGRVEIGLDNELVTRPEIRSAARAALRSQAHAVDLAEAARDVMALTDANRVYLAMRHAEGLAPPAPKIEGDSWDQLVAELGRPGAGASDTADT
jgi:hypothetical protein